MVPPADPSRAGGEASINLALVSFETVDAGCGLTLPSAPQRPVQLDHGSKLIPRGRGELQLRAEELALDVKNLELAGETTLVAKRDERERSAVRRHAALALRADLPNLAERLLGRLQIPYGRLLLTRLEALDRVSGPPRREEGNAHGGTDRPKP